MFDFFYNPKGRISRKGYLTAYLLPYLFLVQIAPMFMGGVPMVSTILGVVGLFFLIPSLFVVPVKRFHDIGLSGWYQGAVIGLLLIAAFIFIRGLMPEMASMSETQLQALQAASPAEQQLWMKTVLENSKSAQMGLLLIFAVLLAQVGFFSFVKGQPQPNVYGNDPLVSGRGYAD